MCFVATKPVHLSFIFPKLFLCSFSSYVSYFIACFFLLDLNVPFQHFPCRFIFGVFFKIVMLRILETCECHCVCFLVNLSVWGFLYDDVLVRGKFLLFFTAFTLLCENCTLYATCGHRPETQHSSTTPVHTWSQWEDLSIPCSEWLGTGGCSTRGACSAAASYAKPLLGQTEGKGEHQVSGHSFVYYRFFLIIKQLQHIL